MILVYVCIFFSLVEINQCAVSESVTAIPLGVDSTFPSATNTYYLSFSGLSALGSADWDITIQTSMMHNEAARPLCLQNNTIHILTLNIRRYNIHIIGTQTACPITVQISDSTFQSSGIEFVGALPRGSSVLIDGNQLKNGFGGVGSMHCGPILTVYPAICFRAWTNANTISVLVYANTFTSTVDHAVLITHPDNGNGLMTNCKFRVVVNDFGTGDLDAVKFLTVNAYSLRFVGCTFRISGNTIPAAGLVFSSNIETKFTDSVVMVDLNVFSDGTATQTNKHLMDGCCPVVLVSSYFIITQNYGFYWNPAPSTAVVAFELDSSSQIRFVQNDWGTGGTLDLKIFIAQGTLVLGNGSLVFNSERIDGVLVTNYTDYVTLTSLQRNNSVFITSPQDSCSNSSYTACDTTWALTSVTYNSDLYKCDCKCDSRSTDPFCTQASGWQLLSHYNYKYFGYVRVISHVEWNTAGALKVLDGLVPDDTTDKLYAISRFVGTGLTFFTVCTKPYSSCGSDYSISAKNVTCSFVDSTYLYLSLGNATPPILGRYSKTNGVLSTSINLASLTNVAGCFRNYSSGFFVSKTSPPTLSLVTLSTPVESLSVTHALSATPLHTATDGKYGYYIAVTDASTVTIVKFSLTTLALLSSITITNCTNPGTLVLSDTHVYFPCGTVVARVSSATVTSTQWCSTSCTTALFAGGIIGPFVVYQTESCFARLHTGNFTLKETLGDSALFQTYFKAAGAVTSAPYIIFRTVTTATSNSFMLTITLGGLTYPASTNVIKSITSPPTKSSSTTVTLVPSDTLSIVPTRTSSAMGSQTRSHSESRSFTQTLTGSLSKSKSTSLSNRRSLSESRTLTQSYQVSVSTSPTHSVTRSRTRRFRTLTPPPTPTATATKTPPPTLTPTKVPSVSQTITVSGSRKRTKSWTLSRTLPPSDTYANTISESMNASASYSPTAPQSRTLTLRLTISTTVSRSRTRPVFCGWLQNKQICSSFTHCQVTPYGTCQHANCSLEAIQQDDLCINMGCAWSERDGTCVDAQNCRQLIDPLECYTDPHCTWELSSLNNSAGLCVFVDAPCFVQKSRSSCNTANCVWNERLDPPCLKPMLIPKLCPLSKRGLECISQHCLWLMEIEYCAPWNIRCTEMPYSSPTTCGMVPRCYFDASTRTCLSFPEDLGQTFQVLFVSAPEFAFPREEFSIQVIGSPFKLNKHALFLTTTSQCTLSQANEFFSAQFYDDRVAMSIVPGVTSYAEGFVQICITTDRASLTAPVLGPFSGVNISFPLPSVDWCALDGFVFTRNSIEITIHGSQLDPLGMLGFLPVAPGSNSVPCASSQAEANTTWMTISEHVSSDTQVSILYFIHAEKYRFCYKNRAGRIAEGCPLSVEVSLVAPWLDFAELTRIAFSSPFLFGTDAITFNNLTCLSLFEPNKTHGVFAHPLNNIIRYGDGQMLYDNEQMCYFILAPMNIPRVAPSGSALFVEVTRFALDLSHYLMIFVAIMQSDLGLPECSVYRTELLCASNLCYWDIDAEACFVAASTTYDPHCTKTMDRYTLRRVISFDQYIRSLTVGIRPLMFDSAYPVLFLTCAPTKNYFGTGYELTARTQKTFCPNDCMDSNGVSRGRCKFDFVTLTAHCVCVSGFFGPDCSISVNCAPGAPPALLRMSSLNESIPFPATACGLLIEADTQALSSGGSHFALGFAIQDVHFAQDLNCSTSFIEVYKKKQDFYKYQRIMKICPSDVIAVAQQLREVPKREMFRTLVLERGLYLEFRGRSIGSFRILSRTVSMDCPGIRGTGGYPRTDSEKCHGKGHCVSIPFNETTDELPPTSYRCDCRHPYSPSSTFGSCTRCGQGTQSDTFPQCVSALLCAKNCSGHGACTSSGCRCSGRWSGLDCEVQDDGDRFGVLASDISMKLTVSSAGAGNVMRSDETDRTYLPCTLKGSFVPCAMPSQGSSRRATANLRRSFSVMQSSGTNNRTNRTSDLRGVFLNPLSVDGETFPDYIRVDQVAGNVLSGELTISGWVQVNGYTRGFVIAKSDTLFYTDGSNPILEALLQDSADRFAPKELLHILKTPNISTYRPYFGLLVDGPSKRVSLCLCNPKEFSNPDKDKFFIVRHFRLGPLAAELFDSRWHFLTLRIFTQKRSFFGLISVDGATNRRSPDLMQCLPFLPTVSSGTTAEQSIIWGYHLRASIDEPSVAARSLSDEYLSLMVGNLRRTSFPTLSTSVTAPCLSLTIVVLIISFGLVLYGKFGQEKSKQEEATSTSEHAALDGEGFSDLNEPDRLAILKDLSELLQDESNQKTSKSEKIDAKGNEAQMDSSSANPLLLSWQTLGQLFSSVTLPLEFRTVFSSFAFVFLLDFSEDIGFAYVSVLYTLDLIAILCMIVVFGSLHLGMTKLTNKQLSERLAVLFTAAKEAKDAGKSFELKFSRGEKIMKIVVTILNALYMPLTQQSIAVIYCHQSVLCLFDCYNEARHLTLVVAQTLILFVVTIGVPLLYSLVVRHARDQFHRFVVIYDAKLHNKYWKTFVDATKNAMSAIYMNSIHSMAYFDVFLLLYRGVFSLVTLLLEPDSAFQLIAISAVQSAFCLFSSYSRPYFSSRSNEILSASAIFGLGVVFFTLLRRVVLREREIGIVLILITFGQLLFQLYFIGRGLHFWYEKRKKIAAEKEREQQAEKEKEEGAKKEENGEGNDDENKAKTEKEEKPKEGLVVDDEVVVDDSAAADYLAGLGREGEAQAGGGNRKNREEQDGGMAQVPQPHEDSLLALGDALEQEKSTEVHPDALEQSDVEGSAARNTNPPLIGIAHNIGTVTSAQSHLVARASADDKSVEKSKK